MITGQRNFADIAVNPHTVSRINVPFDRGSIARLNFLRTALEEPYGRCCRGSDHLPMFKERC